MSLFQPDRYLSRITQVDVQSDLLHAGKRGVLLDIDNTIRARDTHTIPDDVRAWLDEAREAGVRFCLLSNNWHANAHELAAQLDMPIVAKACKPLPFGYLKAARELGLKRNEVVAIGDQLLTDVLGANVAGVSSYLVQPLVETDLKHTLMLRNVERALLHGRQPEQHLYIVGHPIGHSKSPAMYNAVYGAAGLPWQYGSMDLAEEQQAREFLRQADFLSVNITTPFKPLALAVADESDINAKLARGANLLVNTGKPGAPYLHAYNVDGAGCIAYLQREGVRFEGAQVVVCGTGPTALSIMHAAVRAGARVTLLGRDAQKAADAVEGYKRLAAESAGYEPENASPVDVGRESGFPPPEHKGAALNTPIAGTYAENAAAISSADIIIDATSLGMHEGDPAPFDTSSINAHQVVFDTVYGHGTTALIAAARAAGARAFDGQGMLVGQAVETLGIVTAAAGVELPFTSDEVFERMAHAAGFSL